MVVNTLASGAARGRTQWREIALFILLLSPNFAFLAAFVYWPLIYQGYLSLTIWDMLSPEKIFVGLENYQFLLQDAKFLKVTLNTFYFVGGGVLGSLALGLLLALLLDLRLRGRQFVRSLVFTPTIISGAAVGLVWVYILDPRFGLLRLLLGLVGLESPNWLLDQSWAMPALIMVYIWKNVGYSAVIYLAGLQNIPADLYEAAAIDGAGAWRQFWRITLPLLSPISFFIVVTTLLASFQAFDITFVMTRGGPVDATNTLIYYLYEEGFIAFRAGSAAAIGMILFGLMLAITIVQFVYAERRIHYQ